MKISTPHDRLFRAIFSQPRHAVELLRAVLPADLVQHLDFRTLRRVPNSFVDDRLGERRADLVFEVSCVDSTSPLVVLCEHQSGPDPRMPYRMLRYAVDAYDDAERESKGTNPLPVVIPLVVHHGEGGWGAAPRRLRELQDVPRAIEKVVQALLPDITFILADLASRSDDELLGDPHLSALPRLVLWCLKHGRRMVKVPGWSRMVAELMNQVVTARPDGDALVAVGRYILEVVEMPRERIQELLAGELDPQASEALQTAAEQLRNEGRIEAGIDILMELLRQRFEDLPSDIEQRVRSADSARLKRWSARVLSAPTLEDVLAEDDRDE